MNTQENATPDAPDAASSSPTPAPPADATQQASSSSPLASPEAPTSEPGTDAGASSSSPFPEQGAGWDATKDPPPDAATGAGADWQPPESGGEPTAPPPTAPDSAAAAAQDANPDETISQSSFDVVASDGSTVRNTPEHSDLPCPVCGAASLKTTNVQSATPTATLRGETVNPGDQIVVCDACGTTIDAGDTARFAETAKSGAFGPVPEASAKGQAATVELEAERQTIDRERQALQDRLAALEDREQRLADDEARVVEDLGQPADPTPAPAPATTTTTTDTQPEGGTSGNG